MIRTPEWSLELKSLKETPDEVLVLSAILGDLGSFDELASRYRAAAIRTAYAIVGREHAEDVVQDALMLAFKNLPALEEPSRFAAWLAAITRNRALRFSSRANEKGTVALDELLLERVRNLSDPVLDQAELRQE